MAIEAAVLKPYLQDELATTPFNMTDRDAAAWVRGARLGVCGKGHRGEHEAPDACVDRHLQPHKQR